MNDELDRIRSLRGDAPAPSDDWVADTRAELLAMAAEEEEEKEERRAAATAGPLERLGEQLAALVAGPRMAAAAGVIALVVVVAVGVVLLTNDEQDPAAPVAGGTASPQSTPESQPTSTPPSPVVLASSCEAGDGTYTIGYPEDWHTNSGEVAEPCEFFDTQPVELEAQTGGAPEQPVVVDVLPIAFDRATDPGPAEEETARTETTVAGRDAVVVEWTSTGEGAGPEGVRSYRYLIDLDGRTLMVAAHDLGEGPFDTHVEVVDAMVGSLEIPAP